MASGIDKQATVQTTVRFLEATRERLENAARLLKRPMNQIIEEALHEYFRNRGLIERYVVNVNNGHVVLLKVEGEKSRVIDVQKLNGVPIAQVVESYALQVRAPVSVEIEGESS